MIFISYFHKLVYLIFLIKKKLKTEINPVKKSNDHPIVLNGNSLNLTALTRHHHHHHHHLHLQQQTNLNNSDIIINENPSNPSLKSLDINKNHFNSSEQANSFSNTTNQNVYLIATPIDLLATSAQVIQQQQQQQQSNQHHHIINHLKAPTTVITAPVAQTTSITTKSSHSAQQTALYPPVAGSTITISTNNCANGSTIGGLLTNGMAGVTTVTLSSPVSSSSSSMNSSSSVNSPKGVRDEKRRANHNEGSII